MYSLSSARSPFFFAMPFIVLAALFSLLLTRNSDPRSHCRIFFPLPTVVQALHFNRENISDFCSLVDSHRLVPTHARSSQLVGPFLLLPIYSKSHHGGNQTPGPTLPYTTGYPYLHDASANKNVHVSNASIAVCVFASISKKQRGLSSSRTTASTSTET